MKKCCGTCIHFKPQKYSIYKGLCSYKSQITGRYHFNISTNCCKSHEFKVYVPRQRQIKLHKEFQNFLETKRIEAQIR